MKRSSRRAVLLGALILGLGLGSGSETARADWFIRGDADASGRLNITDPIRIFRHLFLGDSPAPPCLDAADADGNGKLELTDGILVLQYLFLGGASPQAPFPDCGIASGTAVLGCAGFVPCRSRGVFYCFDKSGSMMEGGKYARWVGELMASINPLSEDSQFAIIFFDTSMVRFPDTDDPATATPEMKTAVAMFLQTISIGHSTCCKPALLKALLYAGRSTVVKKRIIYISDGYTTCAGKDQVTYGRETLAAVKEANTGGIPIDTICVGLVGRVDEAWMQKLAEENGGRYERRFE